MGRLEHARHHWTGCSFASESSHRASSLLTSRIVSPRAAGSLPLLRGSLIERYKACGKPGCKCAHGRGHGPKYYLSVSYTGQRPQMDYVPQEHHAQTTECLARHPQVRQILEEICGINHELLRRREAI